MARPKGHALVQDTEALSGVVRRPLFRDAQLQDLRACLPGDREGLRPLHFWLHGPPGTGKTLCARHLLEHEVKPRGVPFVMINCRERFTFLSVIEAILASVRPLRAIQRSRELQLGILRRELAERPSVIVLDDIDVLHGRDATDLVHHLTALRRLSLICIAATRQLLLQLPDATKSRFTPRQVLFPRYTPEETVAILETTIALALHPDSCPRETLHRIAELAYGDVRRALALLRHAIHRAEEAHDTSIRPDHLHRGNFDHYDARVEDELDALSSHYRHLHTLVSQHGPIPGPALEEAYIRTCERQGVEPVSTRTVTKYLNILTQRRMLRRERGPGTAGWIYRIDRRR